MATTIASDSTTASPAPDEGSGRARRDVAAPVSLGELAALSGVTGVAAVGTCSLALAQAGRHDGAVALALGLALAAAVMVAAHRFGGRPRIAVDPVELGFVAVASVAALWFFLPGFHYAAVDKDPGAYVAHAFVIARDGAVTVDDPVALAGMEPARDLAGRFPGIWTAPGGDPGQVTSQFYHQYSSTLATAYDLGGRTALFNLNPVLAALSVTVTGLAARRALGTPAAAIGTALLVTSMMQVWQAKYPSTEVLAQLLLSGALLGGVLATGRRFAGAALVSGILLGTGFLVRPDGFLYILFAAVAMAAAIASGRADRRVAALAAGLALTVPYAFYNAYEARGDYSDSNHVPGPLVLVAAFAGILAGGVAVRWLVERWVRRERRGPPRRREQVWQALRRWQRPVGLVAAGSVGLVLLALYHRETLIGRDHSVSVFSAGESVRSYGEMNMVWLSWFVSRTGLVVMWLGLCVLAVQRWQAPRFVLILPGLALLPLYAFDARVSMRLMWWVRRFVPAVLPAVALLMGVALAWAITNHLRPRAGRWGLRVVGSVALAGLLIRFAGTSLPLRSHQEMGGSWEMAEAVASHAGDERGLFLYPRARGGLLDPIRNTPGAVWWIFDQDAARLENGYDLARIEAYQRAFPDRPVFLVTGGDDLPGHLPRGRFEQAGVVIHDLVTWTESTDFRPDDPVTTTWGMTVWRLTPEPQRVAT